MRRSVDRLALLALFLAAALPAAALAWPPVGVVVAPVPNTDQFEPHVLLGRDGHVLAFWSDDRWHDSFDVYGQLLVSNGLVAPGWPDTGLMIARAPNDQRAEAGLSHPDGSFIVGIADLRNHVIGGTGGDTYITRVLPSGGIDSAWPRQGFRVFDRVGDDTPYRMAWVAPDTLVVLSGYAYPDGIGRQLFQQVAVTPAGPQLPWGPQGMLYQWRPNSSSSTLEMVPDGASGVFVVFDELLPSQIDDDLYLMRLGRDGQPAAGWEAGARPLSVAPGVQEDAALCRDGVGGMYVAWGDASNGAGLPFPDYTDFEDIRLLHLTAEGAVYPGWSAEGLLVSDAPGAQRRPSVLPDGAGGVYVAWDDVTIAVTHVRADGTFAPGWAKNGIQVSTLSTYADNSRMVLDGGGGVFVEFEDISNNDLYLQHVLRGGAMDPLWPSAGYKVGGSDEGDIVSDGAGGCYVAGLTQLVQFGPALVAVNRFGLDGVVAVKLAEATAEAEPGRVHIVWRGADVAASEARVERRNEASADWQELGSPSAAGRDALEFDDLTAAAGASYVYRLVRGAEVLSQEVSVTVPAAAMFALRGATPNPALARELTVSFSLAGAGAAKLEVLDLAGRREYTRSLTGLAAGHHALALAEARLAPGVHWLHLSEAEREAIARVVVVR